MAKKTKNICSICGQEYYGYGNNAQPINNGRCCDECNRMAVIPMRILLGKVWEDIENRIENVVEMKTDSGFTFFYHKTEGIITDGHKIYISDITDDNVNTALYIIDVLTQYYTYRICKYKYLEEDYKEFFGKTLNK